MAGGGRGEGDLGSRDRGWNRAREGSGVSCSYARPVVGGGGGKGVRAGGGSRREKTEGTGGGSGARGLG